MTKRCAIAAAALLALAGALLALAPPASAETFVNRWTQVQIGVASGAPVAVAGAPGADWTIEQAGGGFVRLKNAGTGQYLNVEKGLAVGPIQPGWWSAQWTLEQAGEFVRIKNRWTGVYLNVEKGPLAATPAQPGWWSAQWQVAAGQGAAAAATPQPAAAGAAASWSGKSWRAGSQNAMSSTGDITTNPTEILFSNGTRLPVRVVKDGAPGTWGFSKETGGASILEVTQPGANPILLEGNKLCGSPVKYVSLWQEARGGLYLAAYLGPDVPGGIDAACAVYFYGQGG